jgi:hypothetical protein
VPALSRCGATQLRASLNALGTACLGTKRVPEVGCFRDSSASLRQSLGTVRPALKEGPSSLFVANGAWRGADEKRQGMKVRTVVTGHDAKGRAVFVRDEQVDGTPIPGIGELAFLWNADEPATYPNAGNNPAAPGIFPSVGGIRYIIGTYLPGVIAPEPTPEMHLEDGDEPGGANDGFHRTDTTDFGVLLSGNMALELDDGAEVVLSPGDVLIENGTRHRWRVVGDVPATLASFIIGARRH